MMSIRLRLTLWYGGLLAAAMVLFSVTVYIALSHAVLNNLDTALHTRVIQLRASVDVVHGRAVPQAASEQPDARLIPAAILSPSGTSSQGALPDTVRTWLTQAHSSVQLHFLTGTSNHLRIAVAPVLARRRVAGYVVAWQSLRDVEAATHSLLVVMLIFGPGLLALAAGGGLLLARRALEPVVRITQTASTITANDLNKRVPVGSAHDELQELATTFNAMIDRLQSAVERERRFTADASHELRSPLAVIRAETTLALERIREVETYQDVLIRIDEQARALDEMVGALLLLAREQVGVVSRPETLSLRDVVVAAIDQCEPAVHATNVRVVTDIPADLHVAGSTPLLTHAIRNVVDNAIKASPAGGRVEVNARERGDYAVLSVSDSGGGIDPAFHDRIFEPFYQVNAARTPGTSHGLGLAICRRIIHAHGGDVTVSSHTGAGARFDIALPIGGLQSVDVAHNGGVLSTTSS